MPDTDHWTAISELRVGHTRHERELGALTAGFVDIKDDVNRLGDESRKTRHDLRTQITAVEARLVLEMAKERDSVDRRVRSAYVLSISIFTLALVVAGTVVALST